MEPQVTQQPSSQESNPSQTEKPQSAPRSVSDLSQDPVVMQKVQYFDQLDARYKSDQKFNQYMNVLLKGDYDKLHEVIKNEETAKASSRKSSELTEQDELDIDDKVAQRLADLNRKVDEVRNVQAFKDVTGYKTGNGMQYLQAFDTLADEAGYAEDTAAYHMVYQLAEKAGKDYAKKIGLVDQFGNPDPQVQFNPQLIKKAFEIAHNQMRQIGYDAVEDKRKAMNAAREERRKKQDARLMEIIKPEKLKTIQDRSAAMERGLKYIMKSKYGVQL